jgi:hypothetical protein
MSLLDCLLMTLFNAAICVALPKAIYLMQQQKANSSQKSQPKYAP